MKRPDRFDVFFALRAIAWGALLFVLLWLMWWTK